VSVRSSLLASFLDRYAALGLNIASSMVLARLLTPTEVGVFSVVMVLLALVNTVRDLGAGQYLLQAKELTPAMVRSVWAVQLGLGSLLALLTLAGSQPVAAFYRDERIVPIMALLALNYLANPFGSITYAWLMREMRFATLAWARFASALAGALLSIGLAWKGFGPISLAWGSLATTVVNALVLSLARPANFPWLPGLQHFRDVLAFGSRLTGASVLNTLTAGAPEFLLARLQSLTAAGFYSRAGGLVAMFRSLVSDAVMAVALPLFAKAAREQRDVPAAFARVQAYMTAVGWSFGACTALLAYPAVRVLYGDQWDPAVPLVRWLALALLFQVPVSTCQTALASTGGAPALLRASSWASALTLSLTAFGAWQGMEVLAACMLPAALGSLGLWLWQVRRHLGLSLGLLARACAPSLGVALCCAAGPGLVVLLWGWTPAPAPALALGVPTAILGFLAGCWLFKHPLREELTPVLQGLRRPR